MAASNSTKKPTRVSKRILNIKKAAAAAAAVVVTSVTENSKKNKKNKATRKRNHKAPAKNTKRGRPTKASPGNVNKAKKACTAHHRFFLEPEQLSDVLEQHNTTADEMMWVSGAFHAAGPGVEVPVGSVEIDIKVPKGLKFLRVPGVLRLVAAEDEDEEVEMEDEDEEVGMEDEDSELSELSEYGGGGTRPQLGS
jgi:hypothetical protein